MIFTLLSRSLQKRKRSVRQSQPLFGEAPKAKCYADCDKLQCHVNARCIYRVNQINSDSLPTKPLPEMGEIDQAPLAESGFRGTQQSPLLKGLRFSLFGALLIHFALFALVVLVMNVFSEELEELFGTGSKGTQSGESSHAVIETKPVEVLMIDPNTLQISAKQTLLVPNKTLALVSEAKPAEVKQEVQTEATSKIEPEVENKFENKVETEVQTAKPNAVDATVSNHVAETKVIPGPNIPQNPHNSTASIEPKNNTVTQAPSKKPPQTMSQTTSKTTPKKEQKTAAEDTLSTKLETTQSIKTEKVAEKSNKTRNLNQQNSDQQNNDHKKQVQQKNHIQEKPAQKKQAKQTQTELNQTEKAQEESKPAEPRAKNVQQGSTKEDATNRELSANQPANVATNNHSNSDNNSKNIAAENSGNQAKPLKRPQPIYPNRARALNQEGSVEVMFDVNSNGKLENIRIINATPKNLFEEEVKRALKKWQYERKASQNIRLTINFRLNGIGLQ